MHKSGVRFWWLADSLTTCTICTSMHLPESSTVTSLLLLLDFELSPFFADVVFLQQNKNKGEENLHDVAC